MGQVPVHIYAEVCWAEASPGRSTPEDTATFYTRAVISSPQPLVAAGRQRRDPPGPHGYPGPGWKPRAQAGAIGERCNPFLAGEDQEPPAIARRRWELPVRTGKRWFTRTKGLFSLIFCVSSR